MLYENKLLLYLSFLNINEGFISKVKDILSMELDWNYFIGITIHNRVVPIIYENLSRLSSTPLKKLIPDSVLETIRKLNFAFLGHSLIMHEEARKIFNLLKAEGIKFAPIKGVLLAETVYPKKNHRFFADIDLLFPNNYERKKAEKKITELGYDSRFFDARESAFHKKKHGNIINCELHRSLSIFPFFEYPSQIEGFWEKTYEFDGDGGTINVTSGEHMFLILCLHSFSHGSFNLRDLWDGIHILEKYPNFDWKFIIEQVREYPCALSIPISLFYNICTEFLNVNLIGKKVYNQLSIYKISPRWKSVKHLSGFPKFPILYKKFCRECINYKSCSLFRYLNFKLKREIYRRRQNRKLIGYYIRLCILEYHSILTLIRERCGIKYALKCFYLECVGILFFIISRILQRPLRIIV